MRPLKLKVLSTAVNCVTLQVDRAGHPGARIYRSGRANGGYEEVGVAQTNVYVDVACMEPGRTYYYIATSWTSPWLMPEPDDLKDAKPVQVKIPRAPKEKSFPVDRKHQEFAVKLGGFLDESNTVTKQPMNYCAGPGHRNPPHDQVFEPNLYVAIENTGDADVINPWLVANGQRDWWSVETMADEIRRNAGGRRATETEKAMAVWRLVSEAIYDQRAGKGLVDSVADPVRLFNSFGFDGCTANAAVSRRLSEALGLKAREVRLGALAFLDGHGRGACCDHDIYEVWADGAWHFLDTDLIVFLLNRDNRTVAGTEDLVRDADLLVRSLGKNGRAGRDLLRTKFYYEHFRKNMTLYASNKTCAWNDNAENIFHSSKHYPATRTMALRLRPGEKLVRYWGNIGKNIVHGLRLHPEVRFSNGKLMYRPNLRKALSLKGVESCRGVVQEASKKYPALHPGGTGKTAELVWQVESPYAIAGARLGLVCRRETREDALEVMVSRDGKNWRSIWVTPANESGKNDHVAVRMDACIELDWFVNPDHSEKISPTVHTFGLGPCYGYFVKVAMWAGSSPKAVGLDAIRFDTDIQCATRSLPSLFCGKNKIKYRDEAPGRRKVKVTYGWQEDASICPPEAPEPIYPQQAAQVDALDFEFRWKRARGNGRSVDDYHIQISRYADFRWCVSPMFDRYLSRGKYGGKTRWQAELPNLLNPDEKYFWRVRARNVKGVWSGWSRGHSFVPHGPGIVMNIKIKRKGRSHILAWSANANGNRPVGYRVHGSMQTGGFSASRKNLLAVVTEAEFSLKGAKKGMFYRVVALDANGVVSTPSEFVQL